VTRAAVEDAAVLSAEDQLCAFLDILASAAMSMTFLAP
jgi:hypothetical protein